jgi:hypothetical protein
MDLQRLKSWADEFEHLKLDVLSQFDFRLSLDANYSLLDALERCDKALNDIYSKLNPGESQYHDDLLIEDVVSYLRTASPRELLENADVIEDDISTSIEGRLEELAARLSDIERQELLDSAYGNNYRNVLRLLQETSDYQIDLKKVLVSYETEASSPLLEFNGDIANAYGFVRDGTARSRLVSIHKEVIIAEKEQLSFACIVLLKSLIEGLLVWALQQIQSASESAYVEFVTERNRAYGNTNDRARKNPCFWDWDATITIARRLGIIRDDDTVMLCRNFNSSRNRIHPWKRSFSGEEPNTRAFLRGKIAYIHLLKDIAYWRHRN